MRIYRQEKEMYPDVCKWLMDFLSNRFRLGSTEVYDLSRTSLSRFLASHNMGSLPPEWVTWDIKVDIVGFIKQSNKLTSLAFVECKITPLTLVHLSQLLGYCRIALPVFSFLISPSGLSSSLISLFHEYQRYDVLEYYWEKGEKPRRVTIAKWDTTSCNINRGNIISGD